MLLLTGRVLSLARLPSTREPDLVTPIPTRLSESIVLDMLDQPSDGAAYENHYRLREAFSVEDLAPHYIAAYRKIRRRGGRLIILYALCGLSRTSVEIVELGRLGLKDRSWIVRERACALLAYALKPETIPDLEALLEHKDERTRVEAAAAINAIVKGNHNLYVDRRETGKVFWRIASDD
jgi:HEAT repeat protein